MSLRTCRFICLGCLIFIALLLPVLIGQLQGQTSPGTIACKTESVTLDHKVYWWHTHSIIVWPDGTKTAKLLSIYPQEEQNKALQACPKFFKELKKRQGTHGKKAAR